MNYLLVYRFNIPRLAGVKFCFGLYTKVLIQDFIAEESGMAKHPHNHACGWKSTRGRVRSALLEFNRKERWYCL